MGFLVEDKPGLWREWQSGAATAATAGVVSSGTADAVGPDKEIHTEPGGDLHGPTTVMRTAQQRSAALRRKIPLYVGLTTGFCGSFTSFSAFARDIFLALANGLPSPVYHEPPTLSSPDSRAPAMSQQLAGRNGGYSVAAVLAVLILTVSLSLSALSFGKHIALLLSDRRWTASVSERFVTRILDPLTVFLALGCWIGAVMMAAFPPYDEWRGQALFAVILAPLGCLIRYYLAVYLNAGVAGFPMGTFVANVSGTLMLGVMYDLQHASIGGVIGCQMLQGVQDGFCGCLTTVSTWAAELKSLRRRQAYVYGLCSVGVSWALLIIVMGSLKWSGGFRQKSC